MENIIAFAIGLIILLVVGKLLVIPIKIIGKLIINGLIGGVVLFLFNILGTFVGLAIEITPINALIAGFLGVPGVILLLLYQMMI